MSVYILIPLKVDINQDGEVVGSTAVEFKLATEMYNAIGAYPDLDSACEALCLNQPMAPITKDD